ncbi:MAG: sigma-70 family RNA polymerase sigma factor [Cyclobacteriaceae bacterium]
MPNFDTQKILDHYFRREYGKTVAMLLSRFGSDKLELVEDAVQEALFKAMKSWPYQKVPDKPEAWIYRTSYNQLIDTLRKEERRNKHTDKSSSEPTGEIKIPDLIEDEELKMVFACCNPLIKEKNSIILSLKLIGGFSVTEIARAFMMNEEAAKKALQRARKEFKEKIKNLALPTDFQLKEKLPRVLKVIYLMFNEGYKASDGDELIKEDLCGEALRLSLILIEKEELATDSLYALISLICFKAARFECRTDMEGNLVTMENQDRSKYNSEYLKWGFFYFSKAGSQSKRSAYFLEAAIEYYYNSATAYSSIRWDKQLALHIELQKIKPSVNGYLHFLIVYHKIEGATKTLEALKKAQPQFQENHLYHTFKAEILQELNELAKAKEHLHLALNLVKNNIERKYLRQKLHSISGNNSISL